MNGKHIELFLVDGVSGGITTAEMAGWTGHVLTGPRAMISVMMKRPEASRNGVYFLLGDDQTAVEGTKCYIGKTENFVKRMRDHEAKKDFWDRLVIMTSKDDAFNEGHWGYLEARLVELAKIAERVSLTNTQDPQVRKLSEAQQSDMEVFIDQLHIVLPVLGVNAIRAPETTKREVPNVSSPVFSINYPKQRIEAHAQLNGDEFTVLEGSTLVAAWNRNGTSDSTRRSYASYRARHEQLLASGAIQIEDGVGRLTRDVVFSSPSTAGAVILGRSCNGRKEWSAEGMTFGQWEERGLDE